MIYWKRKADRTEKLLILAALLVFLVLIFFGQWVEASERHGDTQTINNTVIKKKVYINGAAFLAGVGIGVCVYKRFIENDPCIGEPQKKTSEADDKVTPDNTSDKPIGVRLY